jgi:hypothetical protein
MELEAAIGKNVLTLRIGGWQARARAKSVRRLPPGAPPDLLPAGLTVTEGSFTQSTYETNCSENFRAAEDFPNFSPKNREKNYERKCAQKYNIPLD